jgi:hypothetical protein
VFHDPNAPVRVLDELAEALIQRGFTRLVDAIGYAHRAPEPRVVPVRKEPEPAQETEGG